MSKYGQTNQCFRCLEKSLGQLTKANENKGALSWGWEKRNSHKWWRKTELHKNKQMQKHFLLNLTTAQLELKCFLFLFSLSLTENDLNGFYSGIPAQKEVAFR